MPFWLGIFLHHRLIIHNRLIDIHCLGYLLDLLGRARAGIAGITVRAALLRCADQMPKGENKHNEQDCQPEQRKLPTACPLSAAHFRLGQTASDRFLRSYRLHMPRTAMCMGGFPPIAASVMSFLCFLAMLSLSCDKVVALTGDRAEPSLSPLALLAILPQHCVLSNISDDYHVIFSNSDLLRSSPSCCAQSRSTRFFSLTGPNKSRQHTAFPHCRTSACARA